MPEVSPCEDMFSSPEATHRALTAAGYMTTLSIATTVFLASKMDRPLLLEGPAGGGKTQLARSVADAAGWPLLTLQCYQGIDHQAAIGSCNKSLQEPCILPQSSSSTGVVWKDAVSKIISGDFYIPGPLIAALESPARAVPERSAGRGLVPEAFIISFRSGKMGPVYTSSNWRTAGINIISRSKHAYETSGLSQKIITGEHLLAVPRDGEFQTSFGKVIRAFRNQNSGTGRV